MAGLLGSGVPLAQLIGLGGGLYNAARAHKNEAVLYALLVDEGEVFGYDWDYLGVGVYFPNE